MAARVLADRQFERDVEALAEWLATEVPAWVDPFRSELVELGEYLARFPDIGVPIEVNGRPLRKIYFRSSPYVVWYDRPSADVVRLLRIFHGHADRPAERRPPRRRRR